MAVARGVSPRTGRATPVSERETQHSLAVKPFAWEHWAALWQIRNAQLAEGGIVLSPEDLETPPVLWNASREEYEWDFHRIESVYLRRRLLAGLVG